MQEMYFYSAAKRCVIDSIRPDGKSMISGETFEQVKARVPDVQILTLEEASRALEQSVIDKVVTPITAAQFDAALEELPPTKWRVYGESESFMSSEPISGRVTTIYVRIGRAYFAFADVYTLTHQQIVDKVKACLH
ncbi:hypothetical protein [Noviherbaspirillum galbum]|uniref:Uncharacterized protein n=1 Tax=Noviherbaspirillum galbum TaxID=2709383 RepID=A0A6B3SMW4_9BURK|nr:hypothetical protein [Noviherbaspirillum galbum]NEX60066.1 hypothetical protein [Noviherbaspirillum galbum]